MNKQGLRLGAITLSAVLLFEMREYRLKINLPLRGFVALFLTFTVSVSVISISLFKGQFSAIDLATAKKISEINRLVEQDYYFEVDSDAVSGKQRERNLRI